MTKAALAVCLAVCVAVGVVASAAAAAPDTASGVSIKPVSDTSFHDLVIAPHKGKALLVSFWASYCAPCLAELPKLLEMKPAVQKAGGDIVLINVDPPGHPEQIDKVLKQKGILKIESLQVSNVDPEPFIDAIDKKWMGEVPFAVIYGKDGILRKTLSGEQKPEDLRKEIDDAIR